MDDDHSIIHARCHLHATSSLSNSSIVNTDTRPAIIDEKLIECPVSQADDNLVEEDKRVPTGTRVLINDTNGQIIGQVMKNEINYHYSVDFGDDTYSHDM